MAAKTKVWEKTIGNHTVAVQSHCGKWLAHMGLRSVYDPSGTSSKQEVFADVRDALRFVGYPIDLPGFDIPKELQWLIGRSAHTNSLNSMKPFAIRISAWLWDRGACANYAGPLSTRTGLKHELVAELRESIRQKIPKKERSDSTYLLAFARFTVYSYFVTNTKWS